LGRTELPTDSLKGVHVLLVEDDADSRELIKTMLQYCGALVTAVGSAKDGMSTLHRVQADLLLSDLAMPEEDGYWLIGQVRALPPSQGGSIPAIAITAHGYTHGVDRTLSAGFQGHLQKPIDPWELARTIGDLIGRREDRPRQF
jgi:CheY-like chemotaxis protein